MHDAIIRWNDLMGSSWNPACHDVLLWKYCRYSPSFEYILKSEIGDANAAAEQKLVDIQLNRDDLAAGLDVLSTFIGDLLGHNTLRSRVFLKYFNEE